jgi:four helix bundle protein
MNRLQLEERLIDFAVLGINIGKTLPSNDIGRYLGSQLMRASSSPALNYGESQSAESRKDFVHKLNIVLKELRESLICMKIISKAKLLSNDPILDRGLNECNELISIFVSTIKTTQLKSLQGKL